MSKELSERTLQELWTLFPISLAQPNHEWAHWFSEERLALCEILSGIPFDSIEHIGSTAINGILAKNIVDILITFSQGTELERIAKRLTDQAYLVMSSESKRISLNKGYTINGFAERVFHLHLRFEGDDDEVYFRDYLNRHPSVAAEYEQLKVELCASYKNDRDAYTEAKGEFISKWTKVAKRVAGVADPL